MAAAALLRTFTGGRALPLLHHARGGCSRRRQSSRRRCTRATGKRSAGIDRSYSPPPPPPLPSLGPSRGSLTPPLLLVRVRSHLRSPVILAPSFAHGWGSCTTAGVVRARLSSSRLHSRVGGGVLLRVSGHAGLTGRAISAAVAAPTPPPAPSSSLPTRSIHNRALPNAS